MGIEGLLRQLETLIRRITKDMALAVNPDSEMYEEEEALPLDREGYEPGLGLQDDIEADQRDHMEPNPRKPARKRPPEVFLMNTPDRSDLESMIPYILIQFLSGKDTRTSEDKGYDQYATAEVRLLIATYNEDGQAGGLQVLNILERIRTTLLRGIMLGENYTMETPLDYEVYPDDTGRYFLGEMDMTWRIPVIERDSLTVESAAESGDLLASGLIDKEDIWNEANWRV